MAQIKWEAQIPPPQGWKNVVPAKSATPSEMVEYVTFSIGSAMAGCGLDSMTGFKIVKDIVNRESRGEPDSYNRRKFLQVRKEQWLDKVEEILGGKPAIFIFCRLSTYTGGLETEFESPELLKMVEADPRCMLMASYLNRTGPHAVNPNHLKLFMFLGKHENPDEVN